MADTSVTRVVFNIKSAAFSVDGTTVQPIGGIQTLELNKAYSEQKLLWDGEVKLTIANDQGFTGTMTFATLSDEYEIAMGRRAKLDNGISTITQKSSISHDIYAEFDSVVVEGKKVTQVGKMWIYGVTSGASAESFSQNTESGITHNPYSLSLTVVGINAQDSTTNADYVDSDGNNLKVLKLAVFPGDTGYETFGESVVKPTMTTGGEA